MVRGTLLDILNDLESGDLRAFVFHLQEPPRPFSPIPRGKLENVSREQLAELLLKYYAGKELQVVAQVLCEIPRRDLLKKYNLRGAEATPRTEAAAAAGSRLQEQQLPVSEKTREATPRTNDSVDTAPVQKRVSEKDLMKLANNLGRNCKSIAIGYLGVTKARIEQIEEENPRDAVMCNFYILNDWRNHEGEKATRDQLYHILAQKEVSLDHDVIEFLRSS